MRLLFLALLLLTSCSAFAINVDHTYTNINYDYSITIPSGFAGQGESDSGDGQRFVSANGKEVLAVWGGFILDGDFLTEISGRKNEYAEDWTLTYKVIKPAWASFSGVKGDQIVYVYAVSSCQGDRYAMFDLEYPKEDIVDLAPVISNLVKSLHLVCHFYRD